MTRNTTLTRNRSGAVQFSHTSCPKQLLHADATKKINCTVLHHGTLRASTWPTRTETHLCRDLTSAPAAAATELEPITQQFSIFSSCSRSADPDAILSVLHSGSWADCLHTVAQRHENIAHTMAELLVLRQLTQSTSEEQWQAVASLPRLGTTVQIGRLCSKEREL